MNEPNFVFLRNMFYVILIQKKKKGNFIENPKVKKKSINMYSNTNIYLDKNLIFI